MSMTSLEKPEGEEAGTEMESKKEQASSPEGNFTSYSFKGNYGITDLVPIYPYYSDEWSTTYNPFFKDVTEEEYKKNPAAYERRVRGHNTEYIESLKEQARYGEEYVTTLNLMHHPDFDDNKINPVGSPMESHRMIFIDNTEEK